MDGDKTETIPTNLRLLVVIEEISRAGAPVTPTQFNEVLGLPKPTIHRLFSTLEEEGFCNVTWTGAAIRPARVCGPWRAACCPRCASGLPGRRS